MDVRGRESVPKLMEDALIVGAGPIGLACAISAKRRGLDPLIVDAGAVVDSIARYPVGMTFFTTPELLEIGEHPFACAGEKPTREEALKYYRGVVRAENLRVRTHSRFMGAARVDGGFRCRIQHEVADEDIVCRRLILATGYFDHPNSLGVPGEDAPHVSQYYDEGHRSFRRDVVVVGGGNSAVEAALDLYRCGARVVLVHRAASLKPTIKYWILPDIENRIREGTIGARFETTVVRIEPGRVVVRGRDGVEESLPAQHVYILTGFQPDFALFKSLGVHLHPTTLVPELNPRTLETNVPGVYLAGSITRGRDISEIFIENGRFDGEKIFADLPVTRPPSAAATR
jgi:thioredoxin reductase (NADPH)